MESSSKSRLYPEPFKSEPPVKDETVKRLFLGRALALKLGTEALGTFWDYDGKRWRDGDKRPWIIHGESRSGKSHLARRILIELQERHPDIVTLAIQARERNSAQYVMGELFRELCHEFLTRVHGPQVPDGLLLDPMVRNAVHVISKLEIFEDGRDSVTVEDISSWKEGAEGSGEYAVPAIFKLLSRFATEKSGGTKQTVTLKRPDVAALAEYCVIILDTLWRTGLIKEVVILVDDVDLLESKRDIIFNIPEQRAKLLQALNTVHQAPCVDVVVTSRSWFALYRREFAVLVDLLQKNHIFSADQLIAIHDIRHEEYLDKAPCKFLNPNALATLAEDVKFIPGVFLQHLSQAYEGYKSEEGWVEHDYEWFLAIISDDFGWKKTIYPDATGRILDAVRNGRYQLEVDKGDILAPLDNDYVYQSFHTENSYSITPLLRKILERLEPAKPARATRRKKAKP
ncbi:MAG: ATP-binding protein [Rhodospirillaceae bacterium]